MRRQSAVRQPVGRRDSTNGRPETIVRIRRAVEEPRKGLELRGNLPLEQAQVLAASKEIESHGCNQEAGPADTRKRAPFSADGKIALIPKTPRTARIVR